MSSCRIEYTPLKGKYPSDYTVFFNKPVDEVMTNVIEYCLKNNISIKAIDRKSGLIMSEPYKINTYTFENTNGSPENGNAEAIIAREILVSSKYTYEPEVVFTDIIFTVKEENNKTSMTIMLANTAAYLVAGGSCLREVKSTGYLEKKIIEGMK